MWKMRGTLMCLMFCCCFLAAQNASEAVWSDIDERSIDTQGTRYIVPAQYRTLQMDRGDMRQFLASAPMQYSGQTIQMSIPKPDGTWAVFQVEESPCMAPELAARFPEIRTYRGRGLSDPTSYMRFDMTPQGFHAMVISTSGSYYIDPYYFENNNDVYISFYRKDYVYNREPWACNTTAENFDIEALENGFQGGVTTTGDEMLNYRTAIAATGEYSQFHGGTTALALAAINTALNRVNTVYNRDLAIQMNLIANNDQIIYLNGGTDPYSNNSGSTMLGQNQSNLDSVIGSANYDIGHVFSTGGGGIASLRSPCVAGLKARGVTGLPSPIGDVFYIDFVAHEMGHQWGGNHTFNGSTGNCVGGNRNGATAWEPGSGSTIQAYAGICGAENLQSNSDAYFHGGSMIEMIEYSRNGSGNNCAVSQPLANAIPTNLDPGTPVTLPVQTPFTLVGSATDADADFLGGDVLTYNFEQFDTGAAAPPNTDNGNRAIFRSFFDTVEPERTFPKLSDVLNNTTTFGESLPTTTRNLTFLMTVRDGVGGTNAAQVVHMTDSTAGPFVVNTLNAGGTVDGNSMLEVTWDVANTDNGTVNCQNVDILLSTDGGMTFDQLLADDTANDGSAMVTVPNLDTTTARLKVMASANLFFDINNANFTIEMVAAVCPTEYESWLADTATGGFIDSNGNGFVDVADLISCLP